MNQHEVEERMYRGGINRAKAMMEKAEEAGEAARNPYGATLFRDFVPPLADLIREALGSNKPGARQAHVALLAPLDADAVALLAVRETLNQLLHNRNNVTRRVGYQIGAIVHSELALAQIEHLNPELYYVLANDFGRRRSRSVRHRLTVFKMQAEKAGLVIHEWNIGAREQVGLWLLDQLARLGMVDLDAPAVREDGSKRSGKLAPQECRLSDAVMETIDRIKDFVSLTQPVYGPCVEPPKDWPGMSGGGFHTPEMRRANPYLVKAPSAARELLFGHAMPTVLEAVNALQRTAWRVNNRILDTVVEAAQAGITSGEIISTHYMDRQRPPPPHWLRDSQSKDDMSPEELEEFTLWKRSMAEWYTQRKLAGVRYGRFYSATRAAQMFRDEPALYFVYFSDSRGRLYPLTYGLNPQGSDIQKALLEFSKGMVLDTPDAVRWFHIHGANKWGFDKATLDERVQWVRDRHQQIMDIAAAPLDNRDWLDCDNPLQFLAWAFEYSEWYKDPYGFESRVAVSMDGSCNGLQNFSAMLRDEVGGKATNLTYSRTMHDIYKMVAEAATKRMLAVEEPTELEIMWLKHGIDRSVVKRTCMTTPYGITRRSAVQYVVDDYLSKGKFPGLDKSLYYPAAQTLMKYVWPAIGDVVVKSREAMDWLKASAKSILKARGDSSEGVISWLTPSGFLATQAYYEQEEQRIVTRLHGTTKLLVVSESDEASESRHASGLAPNFVHSMDAAHLHLTAAAASRCGIDALAMIHDDYGTHAAKAQQLFTLIRVCFVDMYSSNDPIEEFAAAYPECPTPPSKGKLDLEEVLMSDYFFS